MSETRRRRGRPVRPGGWCLVAATLVAAGAVLPGCTDGDDPPPPRTMVVYLVDGQPEAIQLATRDLVDYLEVITGNPVRLRVVAASFRLDEVAGAPEEGIILLGSFNAARELLGRGDSGLAELAPEGYVLRRTAVGGKTVVAAAAGDLLGLQYAIYDLARRLGVRFLHPEEEYVPTIGYAPIPATLDVEEHPGWAVRGFHLDLRQPVEVVEAFLTDDPATFARALRWMDWLVKNRQNWLEWTLLDGLPILQTLARAEELVAYAHLRGLRVAPVVGFTSSEEGMFSLVDSGGADDDRLEIESGLELLMTAGWDGVVATLAKRTFDPPVDEALALLWMETAGDYLTETHGVPFYAVVDAAETGLAPSGLPWAELPSLAPATVAAAVRGAMFWPLEGPAPVLGNDSLEAQLDFLLGQAGARALVYRPDVAFAHGFDVDVPLFLPAYVEARARDLALLEPLAAEGVVTGHVSAPSGLEWGYWLNAWAVAAMTWEPRAWEEVVAEAFDVLGAAGPAVAAVVVELALHQAQTLRAGGGIVYLAGEGELDLVETLAGESVRPYATPYDAFRWLSTEELDAFEALTLAPLAALEADYEAFEARLVAARPRAAAGTTGLVDELIDALDVLRLRAAHTRTLHAAVIAARRAALLPPGLEADAFRAAAEALLAEGAALTAEARETIAVREASYRYPLELSISAENDNPTIYPYRYLARTHEVYYWTRSDDLAARAVSGEAVLPGLLVTPAHARPGDTITVSAGALEGAAGTVFHLELDDGTPERSGPSSYAEHMYALIGQYDVSLAVDAPLGGSFARSTGVAIVLADLAVTGVGIRTNVMSPEAPLVETWLETLLPGWIVGVTGLSSGVLSLALSQDRDGDGVADPGTVAFLPAGTIAAASGAFVAAGEAAIIDLTPVLGPGHALVLEDLVMTGALDSVIAPEALVNGVLRMRLDPLALAELAGGPLGVVGETEAAALIAGAFGYDVAVPPARVELFLDFMAFEIPPS